MSATQMSFEVSRTVAPVRQQVFENLRRAIVEGNFRPGDRLVERELCAMTGASRSSVREALRQLEAEGLILTLPDRGPIVRAVSRSDAEDLYAIRAFLEGMAGAMFATRATDAQIASLRDTLNMLEAAFALGDGRAAVQAKDHFYDILFDGIQSEITQSLLRVIHNRVALVRHATLSHPGRSVDTLREMRGILNAIEHRDVEAARAACVEHVRQAGIVARAVLVADEQAGALSDSAPSA